MLCREAGESLYRTIRESLVRLGGRRPDRHEYQDAGPDSDDVSIDALVSTLGLIEDDTPVRERPGWKKPCRILVTGGTPTRLTWLQTVAPGVTLVGTRGAEDGLIEVVDADAIIGYYTPDMIARGSRLRWLQLHTAGVETALRSVEIAERGILVTNLRRVASPVIAEHVFATLLSLSRKLNELSEHQRHGRWAQHLIDTNTLGLLRGQTLLVAGLGGVGGEVARLAHAFGMRVNAVRMRAGAGCPFIDRIGSSADLEKLLVTADVVVNALPLTSETRGLFDTQRFRAMKRGVVFVNVARGASVVTDDLTRGLQTGHVAAAALDVTDPEPLPRHHPLWRMRNVVITPHVAGLSRASKHWSWLVIRENLRRYVHGEKMLSVVLVNAGY